LADTQVTLVDHAGPWALGRAVVDGDEPVPILPELGGAGGVTGLLDRWADVLPRLEAAAAGPRAPCRPLAGDVMESSITGLGTQVNHCVAEA
jgi:hypothetical protein